MEDSLKRSLKVLKEHESLITMVIGALVILVIGLGLILSFSAKIQKQEKPLNDLYIKANLLLSPSVSQIRTESPEKPLKPQESNLTKFLSFGNGVRDWVRSLENKNSGQITDVSLATAAAEIKIETPTTDKKIYTVIRGDNLWAIAEKTLGSGFKYTELIKANNLIKANLIYPGQELIVPTETLDNTGNQAQEVTTKHVVVEGESLWSIAVLYKGNGLDYPKIVEANRDIIKNPDLIEPGWVLVIPRT